MKTLLSGRTFPFLLLAAGVTVLASGGLLPRGSPPISPMTALPTDSCPAPPILR